MSSLESKSQLFAPLQIENAQPKPATKMYFTPDMTPINRYNIVIDCYNMPCNIVEQHRLEKIAESNTYDTIFQASTHLRGKICFVLLCFVPILSALPLFISAFFAIKYAISLNVHDRNLSTVADPFKKMTFNPEMCFSMGCDYYFFSIELKELEPEVFITNYQDNLNDRLRLRKERGLTNIMIYNACFWASYNYYEKWKVYHYWPLAFSLIMAMVVNCITVLFILK